MQLGSSAFDTGFVGGTEIGAVYFGSSKIWPTSASIDNVTFLDRNDGTAAQLSIDYSGVVTGYQVSLATGDDTLSVTAAQLYAGSGGTGVIEFTDYSIGSSVDISGLTSSSNAATRIAVALTKISDGTAPSNVETVVVSGLDFSAPTITALSTSQSGFTVVVNFDTPMYGTPDVADFTVREDAVSQTISSVSLTNGETFALVTMSSALAESTTIDFSYDGTGDIVDQDGNALAAVTNSAVTNNVTSSVTVTDDFSSGDMSSDLADDADWGYTYQEVGTAIYQDPNADTELTPGHGVTRRVIARHATTTTTDDNYAEVTFGATIGSGSTENGVAARLDASGNGYAATTTASGGLTLWRLDAGAATSLDTDTYTYSAADTLRIECSGSSISATIGAASVSATDATHSSGEGAGLYSDASISNAIAYDTFEGGDL